MGVQEARPQDSMKSTWRTGDRSKWSHNMWTMELLRINPTDLDRPIPVHQKTDKVAYLPGWHMHVWILMHALWPMAAHQLFHNVTGWNLHPVIAWGLYNVAFNINAVHELQFLRELGHAVGFLDGDKHERDQIPDATVERTFRSLSHTTIFRCLMTVMLAYRSAKQPSSMSPWIVVEIGLYGIILDFWFYWYHRCMHEFDGLWKYHRTHHLTKHPTPLLTLFADHEQEVFDIAVIPLMTYGTMKLMGLPMGFYEWWLCHQYIVFTELFGHSGVRVAAFPPSTNNWFLKLFDAELTIEDHDLHHRKGYRKSYNYGKQTLLWDKAFGTTHPRIETIPENIDYEHPVTMQFWPIIKDMMSLQKKLRKGNVVEVLRETFITGNSPPVETELKKPEAK